MNDELIGLIKEHNVLLKSIAYYVGWISCSCALTAISLFAIVMHLSRG